MEEALQPLEADPQTKMSWNFPLGIAASVGLHLVCAAILLSLPQGPSSGPSATWVDLGSIATPPPLTAPAKAAAPTPAAVKPVAVKPEMVEPQESPAAEPAAAEDVASEEPAPPAQPAVAENLPMNSLGIGLTKGFFKGLGNGETLRDDVREYYLAMLERINEKWWMDPQLEKRLSSIVINVKVARDGEIIDIMVLASSGDRRYDRAVLAALAAANPLPPLPDHFNREVFEAPIRLVPPLNLMAW